MNNYSNKSLIHNWFQERKAPSQPMHQSPNVKLLRIPQPDISVIQEGKFCQLERVSRLKPWSTKGIIDDRQKLDYKSQSALKFDKLNLDNKKKIPTMRPINLESLTDLNYPAANYGKMQLTNQTQQSLLNFRNIHQLLNKRPVKVSQSYFDSTLATHVKNFNKMELSTIFQQNYSPKLKDSLVYSSYDLDNSQKRYSKLLYQSKPAKQIPVKLISEKNLQHCQPKSNLSVQKTWLPLRDPGFVAIQKGMAKLPKPNDKDIMTSLPLSTGLSSIQKSTDKLAAFRKIRSEITLKRHEGLSLK